MKHLKLFLLLCCFAPASLVGQEVNKLKHKFITLYAGNTTYSGDMHFLGISDKEKLLVYNPATLTLSKTFVINQKGNITAFGFLPDNKSITAFASDKSITQWDITSGTILNEIKTEVAPVFGVVAGSDHVAFVTEKKMYIYKLSSKSKQFETQAHTKPIRSLAAFPDGTKLITGGGDGKLIIYNIDTGEKSGEIINHKTFIRAIDVSSANNVTIASGDDDGNVIVQDEAGKVKFKFNDAKGWVHSVKFSWDGSHLAAGDDWGNIYIYSLERGLLVEKLSGTNSPVTSLAFSPDGKELAFYEKQKSVRVWSIPKLNLPSVFKLKDQKDRTPPQIYVSNPANIQDDKVRIYKDIIDIRGTLMDESGIRGLKVNGTEIPIKENNNFIIYQPLTMGDNVIVIEAKDINDNISIKRFTVQRKNLGGETYDVAKARNFLFVVGINDYEHWPKLNNAVKDASDITSTLLKQYNFDFSNVTLLKNEQATRSNIYKSLRSLIEQVTPQDNLLIYFSGHGYFDGALNEGYWIPVDAKVNNSGDYLSNSDILKLIGNIDSQHTFLIADACFSGSLFSESKRGYAENVEKYKSRWGLASGRLEVVSDGEIGKNSPFATATITFLNDNTKDKFAISELIQYVKMKVAESSDQTPLGNPLKAAGDDGGEMVLYKKKD